MSRSLGKVSSSLRWESADFPALFDESFGVSLRNESVFGSASGQFTGATDRLYLDGGDDFTFGDGDFTIECWVRFAGLGSTYRHIYDGRSSTDGAYPDFVVNPSGQLVFWVNGAARITDPTPLSTGQWYHVAVARSGQSTKLFKDGVQVGGTWTDLTTYLAPSAARPLIAGDAVLASNNCNGWLDEFRVSKGVARWTANFTPPSLPYS